MKSWRVRRRALEVAERKAPPRMLDLVRRNRAERLSEDIVVSDDAGADIVINGLGLDFYPVELATKRAGFCSLKT
jgi:hypothetical protein